MSEEARAVVDMSNGWNFDDQILLIQQIHNVQN